MARARPIRTTSFPILLLLRFSFGLPRVEEMFSASSRGLVLSVWVYGSEAIHWHL